MSYEPTIGLEIHVELKTKSKMFCGCLNDPKEKHPNINVCPICLGHPGTLPTINKKAVEAVLKLGVALGSEIAEDSHFDRKSYFYPDLPKGYQISQYEKPLVKGGHLKGVRIRRIHLEEDTGRLVHESGSMNNELGSREFKNHNSKFIIHNSSLVDFNRAGVPLMELVTEPDITSAKEAVAFAKELQLILRYLGISDADMEKGQMRIEANVSISQISTNLGTNDTNISEISDQISGNSRALGTKVEVKNINSFKSVHDAIEYELERQEKVLNEGRQVVQETRGWNPDKGITESQRSKESAHDYRYFPEPDLPILSLSLSKGNKIEHSAEGGDSPPFDLEKLKQEIPELPHEKRIRFAKEYGLSAEQVEILTADRHAAQYFEEAVSELQSEDVARCCSLLFNYFTSDLFGLMKSNEVAFENLKITPENFADLIALVEKGELSSRMAKDMLAAMFETGEDPRAVMTGKGMKQVSDEAAIKKAIEEVVADNPQAVSDYKKGKKNALEFLYGQTMIKLQGVGNTAVIRIVLEGELTKGI